MPRDLFEELMKAEAKNREMVKLLEAIKPTDLRDQFAGAALSSIPWERFDTYQLAVEAYAVADAMLKAREGS